MNYFKDLVKIDRYNLSNECVEHSSRYLEICEEYVEAKNKYLKAQDKLDLVLAETDIYYRTHWDDTWGKMTESYIKNMVTLNENVIKATEEVRQAHYELGILESAKNAFDSRKAMLNDLVSLLIGRFYSNPSDNNIEDNIRRRMKKENEDPLHNILEVNQE